MDLFQDELTKWLKDTKPDWIESESMWIDPDREWLVYYANLPGRMFFEKRFSFIEWDLIMDIKILVRAARKAAWRKCWDWQVQVEVDEETQTKKSGASWQFN